MHLIRARPPLMGAAFSGQTAGIQNMIPIHSPAPWSIDFDRINDATGKQVARITPRLTGEHNHKLIAAAPELLAALENLRGSIRHRATCRAPQAFPCSCDAGQLWEMSGAAIAKAKGGAR